MPKIIIRGNSEYVERMFSHLRSEHPSTKRRMVKVVSESHRRIKRHAKKAVARKPQRFAHAYHYLLG